VGKIESGFVKAIEGTGLAAQEQEASLVRIASVASAMPEYRFPQEVITAAFKGYWNTKLQEPEKLDWLHSRVGVDFRHLAFPLDRYRLAADRFWRKAAAHGHFRSCGAGSTVYANRRQISLSGVQIARSHGSSPKASAKSVAEFETFVSVACLRPGFADVAERTAVHDWKFAARVEWLNGH
jgi:hypothetical protein